MAWQNVFIRKEWGWKKHCQGIAIALLDSLVPLLGEHNEAVFTKLLGYGPDDLAC